MSWPQQNWQNAATSSNSSNTNQFMGGFNTSGAAESQYAQYQNWQQWQTYHQQYAQWHAQYGELYQKEMQAQYGTTGSQPPPPAVSNPMGVSLTAPLPPMSLPVGFSGVPPPPPPNEKEPIPPPPDSAPPPPAEPNDSTKLNQPFIGPIFPPELTTEEKKINQLDKAGNNESNNDLNKNYNNFGFNNMSFNSMPPNFNQNANDQNQPFSWDRNGNNNLINNQNNRNSNRFDSNRGGGRDSFGRNNYQSNRDNNQNNRDNYQNNRSSYQNRDNSENSRDNWNQRDNWKDERDENQRDDDDNSRDNWGSQNQRDNWSNSNQRSGDNQYQRDNWNQRDGDNQKSRDDWKNQNQRDDDNQNQRDDDNNWNSQNQRGGGDNNWNNRNQRGENNWNNQNRERGYDNNYRDNWNQNSRNNRNSRFDSGFGANQNQSPQGGPGSTHEDSFTHNAREKPNRNSDSGFGVNQGSMLPIGDKPNRFSDTSFGAQQNQTIKQSPSNDKTNRLSDYDTKSMDDSQPSIKDEPAKSTPVKSDPATGLELTPEEKAFDDQFQTWENEFIKWKKENANHPDRKAYREYEMKFEEFRRKLLDRRETMRKRRLDELNINRRSLELPLENLEQNIKLQNISEAELGPVKSLATPIAESAPTKPTVQQLAHPPPQPVPSKIPSLFDVKIDEKLVEKTKWSTATGIPGLDLIPESATSKQNEKLDEDVAEVINLDDENSPKKADPAKLLPSPAAKKIDVKPHSALFDSVADAKKFDLPTVETNKEESNTLSQGISNILGDPNLVSILNLVQPALSQINPHAINQLNPLLSVIDALTKQQQHAPHQLQHSLNVQPPSLFSQIIPHPDSGSQPRRISKETSAARKSCDRTFEEDEKLADKSIVFESDDFVARLQELKAGKLNLSDNRSNSNIISEVKDVKDSKEVTNKKTQEEEEDDNSFEKRLRDLKAGRFGNLLGDRDQSVDRKSNVSNEESSLNTQNAINDNNNRFTRRSRFTNVNDETKRVPSQQYEMNSSQGNLDDTRNESQNNNRYNAGRVDFNKSAATNNDTDELFKPTQVIDYQNKSLGLAKAQSRWDGVDILMPAKVVDYGHKKPANPITSIPNNQTFGNDFMTPMKTIDYGHTSSAIGQRRHGNDDYLNQYNKRSRYHESNYRDNQDNSWKSRDNRSDNRDYQNNRDYQDNRNSGNFKDSNASGYSNKWVPKNFQQQPQQHPATIQQFGRDDDCLTDNSFDDQIKRARFLKNQINNRQSRDNVGNDDNSNSGHLPDDLEAVSVEENALHENNENILEDADDISAEEFDDNQYDQDIAIDNVEQKQPIQSLPQQEPITKQIPTLQVSSPPIKIELGANTISMDEILLSPGRKVRPPRILIIMRGPPGCGKTFLSKLIKDKEVEMGGSAPRIMSIDDYFMTEIDTVEKCPKTGRDIKTKKMEYEYEQSMEETYCNYLLKSFKKNITDGLFNFIIVDCANETEKSYSDFYNFGKSNGFTPYICQLEIDLQTCLNRNTHKRKEQDIEQMVKNWTTTPEHYLKVDSRALIQSVQISDVEMEDVISDEEFLADDVNKNIVEVDEDEGNEFGMFKSKWETGPSTEENLARLDGTSKPLRQATIEDYLQTDDDVAWESAALQAGKKRVRWADIEEKRAQEKMRAIGFVVGQTDWRRMMDPTGGSGALTQTKYIERLKKK